MIASYKVEYLDGTTETYQGKQGDIVRFEMHFEISAATAFRPAAVAAEVAKATGVEQTVFVEIRHVWYLAYCAAKRAGRTEAFEDWVDLTASIEQTEDDASPLDPESTTTPTSSE